MPTHTEVEQRNLRSVTDVLPFWTTRDIPGVLAFYDEEIRWRNVAMEETYEGKQAVGEFLDRLFSAFPDLHFEVTHKIAFQNNVAEQWFIRGTHRGAFMGIPPTGRAVEIPGMSMVELRDGKFLSDQFYFDSGIVLRQMGLLPSLAVTQSAGGRSVLWLAVHKTRVGLGLGGRGLGGLALARRRGGRRNEPAPNAP